MSQNKLNNTNVPTHYIFQDGDIAEFGGMVGPVKFVKHVSGYPVFHEASNDYYISDGRLKYSHTKPVLNLVTRACDIKPEPKFVEKVFYKSMYKDFKVGERHYETKEEAGENRGNIIGYTEVRVWIKE